MIKPDEMESRKTHDRIGKEGVQLIENVGNGGGSAFFHVCGVSASGDSYLAHAA